MDHYDSNKQLIFATQVLGLGPFYIKPRENAEKPRKLYTRNYSVIIAILIMCSIFVVKFIEEYKKSLKGDEPHPECFLFDIMKATSYWESYFALFLMIVVYLKSYSTRYELMEAHKTLEEVDFTLKHFDYTVPYRTIRNYSWFTLLVLIIAEFLVYSLTGPLLSGDYMEILYSLFQAIPNVIYTINMGIFINFMFALKYRLLALNDLLMKNFKQYLMNPNDYHSRLLNENQLDLLTKTHEKLCDISDTVADSFSVILFCVSTYLFVLIIVQVFVSMRFIIMGATYQLDLFVNLAFLVMFVTAIYSFKLGLIVYSTELVTGQSSKTHAFVHKSINCYKEERIRNKLTIFLMQLINRKPTFTACGLFEINLPLLFSMVGALFTYVIILIQFDQSDKGCVPSSVVQNTTQETTTAVSLNTTTLENLYNNDTEILGKIVGNLTEKSMQIISENITQAGNATDLLLTAIQTNATNLINKITNSTVNSLSNITDNNGLDELVRNSTSLLTEAFLMLATKVTEALKNITDIDRIDNLTMEMQEFGARDDL